MVEMTVILGQVENPIGIFLIENGVADTIMLECWMVNLTSRKFYQTQFE